MTTTITITVDNQHLEIDQKKSLLDNFLLAGIAIPHLCHHPKLDPQGRCGLCLVEFLEGDNWQLGHACLLKGHEQMIVRTESERLSKARFLAASLLQQRGPFRLRAVEHLLSRLTCHKETPEPHQPLPTQGCILCGLCINMCQKIARNRLTFLGRGPALAISYVSDQESCGDCRACASVCPTGFIEKSGAATFRAKLY